MKITTKEEYELAVSKGFCPLCDWRNFTMDIDLRKQIQQELFGVGNHAYNNEQFYRWIWEHKQHYCEETLKPLTAYSAVFVSHILSRGAHPEMAYDCRNVNILSFEAHSKWENGKRKGMRICEENQLIIEMLRNDYENK